jgi:hypothetical protein
LKDDFCATEKHKNPFKIVNHSIASNKSQLSGNHEIVHLAFNDTFTNLDLDFSEGEADDISMTCDIVNELCPPELNKDLVSLFVSN